MYAGLCDCEGGVIESEYRTFKITSNFEIHYLLFFIYFF